MKISLRSTLRSSAIRIAVATLLVAALAPAPAVSAQPDEPSALLQRSAEALDEYTDRLGDSGMDDGARQRLEEAIAGVRAPLAAAEPYSEEMAAATLRLAAMFQEVSPSTNGWDDACYADFIACVNRCPADD